MKSALLFVIAALLAMPAASQERLFSLHEEDGGFGGLITRVTDVNGEKSVMTGTRVAWIFNHTRVLGIAWYGLSSDVDAPGAARTKFNDPDMELAFHYGGLEAEYLRRPGRLLHWGVSALIGAGGVKFTEVAGNGAADDLDVVFVFEPAVSGGINIVTWFRITADIHYRLVTGSGLTGIDNGDLSAFGTGIAFKFGSF